MHFAWMDSLGGNGASCKLWVVWSDAPEQCESRGTVLRARARTGQLGTTRERSDLWARAIGGRSRRAEALADDAVQRTESDQRLEETSGVSMRATPLTSEVARSGPSPSRREISVPLRSGSRRYTPHEGGQWSRPRRRGSDPRRRTLTSTATSNDSEP